MSYFHSENECPELGLTVRVKFLNLNRALTADSQKKASQALADQQVGSGKNLGAKRWTAREDANDPAPINTELEDAVASLLSGKPAELCMQTGERLAEGEFEEHTESCAVCANRVELQLDFMECLEAAVYQRKGQPEAERLYGALLVSAPELNFAVCGELDFGGPEREAPPSR